MTDPQQSNEVVRSIAERGLTVLRLKQAEWEAIEESRYRGTRFSWVLSHDIARNAKRRSLALISVSGHDYNRLLIGFVRSRQAVSTLQSRIVFDLVSDIAPSSFGLLVKGVTEQTLKSIAARYSVSSVVFEKISPAYSQIFGR